MDNQVLDRFDIMDDEESQHIAHNIAGYLEETRSGRKRNRPAWMVDYIRSVKDSDVRFISQLYYFYWNVTLKLIVFLYA